MANKTINPVAGQPEEQHYSQLDGTVKDEVVGMQGLGITELKSDKSCPAESRRCIRSY